MKVRVVVTQDGQVSIFTDEGTFAEGKDKIAAIFAGLGALGVNFTETSPVEQHKHEGEVVHTHTHTGPHIHSH